MADLFSVEGKTALVTGGSRGIGLMLVEGLRAAGAQVIAASRRIDPADGIPADLSTPEGCAALAAAVAERTPRLDVLVNNAGATWGAPLDEFPASGWDRVLDTNVKSIFALTQALLPQLRAAASPDDPARVVNVGSVDGIRVPPMENYAYSASKAAVHMLTRHLAKRLAAEHITVNAIAPGPFESKMTAFMLDDPATRDAVAASVPLGRIGRPDDVVGLTTFLASRAGGYVTGAVIPLDGGITGCA